MCLIIMNQKMAIWYTSYIYVRETWISRSKNTSKADSVQRYGYQSLQVHLTYIGVTMWIHVN